MRFRNRLRCCRKAQMYKTAVNNGHNRRSGPALCSLLLGIRAVLVAVVVAVIVMQSVPDNSHIKEQLNDPSRLHHLKTILKKTSPTKESFTKQRNCFKT